MITAAATGARSLAQGLAGVRALAAAGLRTLGSAAPQQQQQQEQQQQQQQRQVLLEPQPWPRHQQQHWPAQRAPRRGLASSAGALAAAAAAAEGAAAAAPRKAAPPPAGGGAAAASGAPDEQELDKLLQVLLHPMPRAPAWNAQLSPYLMQVNEQLLLQPSAVLLSVLRAGARAARAEREVQVRVAPVVRADRAEALTRLDRRPRRGVEALQAGRFFFSVQAVAARAGPPRRTGRATKGSRETSHAALQEQRPAALAAAAAMQPLPAAAIALLLACTAQSAAAAFKLAEACPGNLIINGDFEEPNTILQPSEVWDPSLNNRWGWYRNKIKGWYTTRPDGRGPCVKVDWQRPYIEVARGALATPIEGQQYGELLPNATGNYCQDIRLVKGQTYKLSFYYGRLMTYAKGTKNFTVYPTAIDVAIRPVAAVPASSGIWPKDRQGYTLLASADTEEQFAAHGKQWWQYTATFTAPEEMMTLAFINTKRPKTCGACGSLLDAVCLQKVEAP
ncbi:hypothetical protein HT031_005042 [Scenedesmus sp. PABB004]|nr:hypothetical protein HT031_005042 [Scenedesmus sp. PABB004]